MYWNILKKDLKRKKTMNVILLIFIILAVMFVSSSANNLVAVTTALNSYFEKAGVPDYFIATATRGITENTQSIESVIKDLDYVTEYKVEKCYFANNNPIEYKGERKELGDQSMVCSFDGSYTHYFDSYNREITKINEGEIYLRNGLLSDFGISVGDKINIIVADVKIEFIVKGIIKDALFGSSMMASPRFVVSQADFDKYAASEQSKAYECELIYINTTNVDALAQKTADNPTIMFSGTKSLFKTTYMMDMIIAGLLLIVSVFLIIISLVILRFTIKFTLSEEFREIGIMKAIGITNTKIRGLYIVKYLAMAIIGGLIGFIGGIPFGNMLLQQASENIVIANENSLFINIAASVLVFITIVLFCYSCTKRIKKITPIEAIRNGQTGERYQKKGMIRLSKSKLHPVPFMAINDILSGFKRFLIVMLTFTISILLVTVILNTMSTLQSDKLVSWFSMKQSDVYLGTSSANADYMTADGHDKIKKYLLEMEQTLADNGIKAKCYMESLFRLAVSKGDKSYKALAFQGTGTTTDEYTYMSGTAPQNTNEVALTYITADRIGAVIGDTVKVTTLEGTKEYIVTAIYQSMTNMGEAIRLHQDVELDYTQAMGFFAYQINYTDNPTDTQKAEYRKTIEELYPQWEIYTSGEYVDKMVGGFSEYMSDIVFLVLFVVTIINILVAVLMEKSFFIKERAEFAMLKAIGFTNRSIIIRQTLRMSIVMVAATLLAILLSEPIGQLTVSGIFRIVGAYSIIFDANILLNYIVCPLVVLVCTIIAVVIVNQQVRTVATSEVNSIE